MAAHAPIQRIALAAAGSRRSGAATSGRRRADTAAAVPRLAVVDDNQAFRKLLREVAEPVGWEVSEFPEGGALFAALGEGLEPDLIMLDMVMPGMDGIETIAALGATSLRCPVILMTGRLPIYTQTAGQLAEAHGLRILETLQKPLPLDELRTVLHCHRPGGGSPGGR